MGLYATRNAAKVISANSFASSSVSSIANCWRYKSRNSSIASSGKIMVCPHIAVDFSLHPKEFLENKKADLRLLPHHSDRPFSVRYIFLDWKDQKSSDSVMFQRLQLTQLVCTTKTRKV